MIKNHLTFKVLAFRFGVKDISRFLWYGSKSSSDHLPQTEDIVQVEKHVTSVIIIWKHIIIHDSQMQTGTSLLQQLGFNVTGNKQNIDWTALKGTMS